MPETPADAYITLTPDWICEVLSPSTETLDRDKKLRIYAREGVPHSWLVNPLRQTLDMLALDAGRWSLLASYEGHCKPWRDSSDAERLDGENGLLLTPTIDHLFDRGFISFETNGRLLVSPVAHPRRSSGWAFLWANG